MTIFAQTVGGAVGVAIGQSIFGQELTKGIIRHAPGIDPAFVIGLGASHIQDGRIPDQYIEGVKQAYNDAIAKAFFIGVAFAIVALFASGFIEWKSVKKNAVKEKKENDVEANSGTETQTSENGSSKLPEVSKVSEISKASEVVKDEIKN